MNWYLTVLKKYAVFNGRARRKEYWMYSLVNFIVGFPLGVTAFAISLSAIPSQDELYTDPAYPNVSYSIPTASAILYGVIGLYWLVTLLPSLAVVVRRLHDTGRSGGWIFIGFVPFVGSIILLVFLAAEGNRGPNAYGPDPKPFTPGHDNWRQPGYPQPGYFPQSDYPGAQPGYPQQKQGYQGPPQG